MRQRSLGFQMRLNSLKHWSPCPLCLQELERGESGTGVVSFRGASRHGHPVGKSKRPLECTNCGVCVSMSFLGECEFPFIRTNFCSLVKFLATKIIVI